MYNVSRDRTDCGNILLLLLSFSASWNSLWSFKGVVLCSLGNSYWVRNPDLSQMSQVEEIALQSFFTEPCPLTYKESPEWSDQLLGLSCHPLCCQCYTVLLMVFKGQEKEGEYCPHGWCCKGSLHWPPALGRLWASKIKHICFNGASKWGEEW